MDIGSHAWTSRSSTGWIEVITGSMFSGKSEELIRRLRRAQIARQKVQIFKPALRHPLQRRPHRLAQRDADPVATRVARRRELLDAGRRRTPRWSASTRGSSSTRSCRRSATRWPNRGKRVIVAGPRPGLPRASRSSRCRSCWRSPSTSPRRWRSAWCAAIRPTTRSGSSRAATACWSARRAPTRRAAAAASIPTSRAARTAR